MNEELTTWYPKGDEEVRLVGSNSSAPPPAPPTEPGTASKAAIGFFTGVVLVGAVTGGALLLDSAVDPATIPDADADTVAAAAAEPAPAEEQSPVALEPTSAPEPPPAP